MQEGTHRKLAYKIRLHANISAEYDAPGELRKNELWRVARVLGADYDHSPTRADLRRAIGKEVEGIDMRTFVEAERFSKTHKRSIIDALEEAGDRD